MKDDDKRFIIYPHGEKPMRDEEGNIISDGAIGRIGSDNCYLTAYPRWPRDGGSKRLKELEVNECIRGVEYSLSGSSGIYDIYRVG